MAYFILDGYRCGAGTVLEAIFFDRFIVINSQCVNKENQNADENKNGNKMGQFHRRLIFKHILFS